MKSPTVAASPMENGKLKSNDRFYEAKSSKANRSCINTQ